MTDLQKLYDKACAENAKGYVFDFIERAAEEWGIELVKPYEYSDECVAKLVADRKKWLIEIGEW